jgi:Asp-tRNA(Asn)/Glu-tRNA(Gln) amidotransferase A subunit family amidase
MIRWGRVCLDGVKSLAPTGDTIGFLARSLSDIELIGGVLGLFTNSPSTPINLKSCKFAFIKTDQFAPKATNDLKNIWAQAKSLLSSAGAEVVDLDLGPRYEGWMIYQNVPSRRRDQYAARTRYWSRTNGGGSSSLGGK